MSIRCMDRVWRYSGVQNTTELAMLLAIADYAHDDGSGAYPSLTTLAKKCRLSRRHAIRTIQALEKLGELQVARNAGPGGANLYTVLSPPAEATEEAPTDSDEVSPEIESPPSDEVSPSAADVTTGSDTGVTTGSDIGVTQSVSQPSNKPSMSPARANFSALAEVCRIDLELITPTQRGKLNQVEGMLRTKKNACADDIQSFGEWWYNCW